MLLVVMRACEGCRRRKIKCDAATTNTWPCSACVRLKLHCVPPMVQYDRDLASNQGTQDQAASAGDFRDDSSGSGEDEYTTRQLRLSQQKPVNMAGSSYMAHRTAPDYRQISPPEHSPPTDSGGMQYSHLSQQPSAAEGLEPNMPTLQEFHNISAYPTHSSVQHNDQWVTDDGYTTAAANVSGVLEQLKIDDSGVGELNHFWFLYYYHANMYKANYISAQGRRLAETPAYEPWAEDFEANPSFVPGTHDFAVRIRPEDMPSEDEALDLFDVYFRDIHPYLPIVNKASFYRQWNTSRDSISPLLLEAMFATSSRINATFGRRSEDRSHGMKWISMATSEYEAAVLLVFY